MRLHDTARGELTPLAQRDPGRVSMYVCGPTVYDHPHVGHGRFVLVFDVLRRYLEWSGQQVTYVSNITDIDDKIIDRAQREERDAGEVAREFEAAWYSATDRLGVKRPTFDPHATAYVEQMVDWVDGLAGRGVAYETSDGVYLATGSVEGYGLLARQSLDSLRAGARVQVAADKRSPLDFALWKKAKAGEPSWPSPWGPGRPGWHTECVVMALDLLGSGFDLHGGGIDLAFPHHENERAQAVAAGEAFAANWVHNGFVEVSGEKMSKSLGNFTTLTQLLDSADARAYRLLVLQSHYRAPVEVAPSSLEAASNALQGLDDFARRTRDLPSAAADVDVLARFCSAMDDDLDTPRAMATLFEAQRAANRALDSGDTPQAAALAEAVREIAAAVGLDVAEVEEVPPAVADALRRREKARSQRDFAAADAIRDDLAAAGWVVSDGPDGPRAHRG